MTRKRILISSGIALGLVLLFLGWYFFIRARHTGVINAMPDDVILFFDISNNKAFDEFIRFDPAMQAAGEIPLLASLYKDYALYTTILSARPDYRNDLFENRCLAGAFSSGNDGVDYLFLLDVNDAKPWKHVNDMPELNGEKPSVDTHVFERETIYELYYPKLQLRFSYATVNGVFMYSTSSVLVENAILQLKKGDPVSEQPGYSKVAAEMEDAPFTIYLQLKKWADHAARLIDNEHFGEVMYMGQYAEWIGLNITKGKGGLQLSGYCSADPEKNAVLAQYSGTVSANMHPAVPANTSLLYRLHTEQLAERLAGKMQSEEVNRAFFDHWSPWMNGQLLIGVSESLDAHFIRRAFMIIPATDIQLAQNKLKTIAQADTTRYHDMEVLHIYAGEVISKLSGFAVPDSCYGTWISDALVIAFDEQQLYQMIDAFQNRTSLALSAEYQSFRSEVSAAYNTSVYLHASSCEQLLRGWLNEKHVDSLAKHFGLLQKFPQMEFQFTAHKDLYLVNGFVQFADVAERPAGLLWSVNIDAPVARGPFTVMNAITGQRNIMVQDTSNVLYLISANGDVLWKRPLMSEVLSEMHEVDFYGNDRTQFLFNTRDAIHLLDAQGEPVEGFPITLTTSMSGPVSVFMSAKNDYRFFVPCDNGNIYGYHKDGKPIAGWNPMRNVGIVQLPMIALPTVKGQAIGFVHDGMIDLRNGSGSSLYKLPIKSGLQEVIRIDSLLYFSDTAGAIGYVNKQLESKMFTLFNRPEIMRIVPAEVDSQIVALCLEDGYIKLLNQEEVAVLIHEPQSPATDLLALSLHGEGYVGYVFGGDKLILLDNYGKARKGFPVEGSSAVVLDDLTMTGDKILITVSGSRILTYRFQ